MGLNTIEVKHLRQHVRCSLNAEQYSSIRDMQLYIPWNYHEHFPGEYTWDGMADVFSFIELIQELDMIVLLRVGPYICAEWDFGGLPWWLGSSQVPLHDPCVNLCPNVCPNLSLNLPGSALVAGLISGYQCVACVLTCVLT